jgi:hypothetical protein
VSLDRKSAILAAVVAGPEELVATQLYFSLERGVAKQLVKTAVRPSTVLLRGVVLLPKYMYVLLRSCYAVTWALTHKAPRFALLCE